MRPSATCSGAQSSPRTLMQRKLEPQIAASATNAARHGSCVAAGVTRSARGRGGDQELGDALAAAALRVPLQPEREGPAWHLDGLGQPVGRAGGHTQAVAE